MPGVDTALALSLTLAKKGRAAWRLCLLWNLHVMNK